VRDLLTGLPSSSGRHGGCRLLILRDGSLLVGTGDAAVGTNPHNLRSLGGKTLRLDPSTGAPWPGNPFIDAGNRRKRYVHTYGHRNVQGLAQRRDGSLWSVEQGTYRDDEVNRLRRGADYGYNPVPGYNEQVPMTDRSLPGPQRAARWRSGNPTLATSGGTWVYGAQWGALNGTLAVAALKAERVIFMKFDAGGHLRWTRAPGALRRFGRIRSLTQATDGDLLVTTDNGNGNDAVLRVTPRP
jgi:glucose/arabinose dehydrogenase